MRIVLDTNVLISALGWQGNEYIIFQKCVRGELTLIISAEIIEEFQRVIQYDRFKFIHDKADDFVNLLFEIGELIQPEEHFFLVEDDPDDNIFLDAAFAGNAAYIISGDKHLLHLQKFKSVKILNAHDFLKE